jgi:hypothetical protein
MATIEARKGPKGTTDRVRIRIDGKPPVTRTLTRLTPAKTWAAATESVIRDGHYAVGGGRTLAAAIDESISKKLAH